MLVGTSVTNTSQVMGGNDVTMVVAVICIPFWPLYLASIVVMKAYKAFCKYILDNLPLHVAKIDVSKWRHGKYTGETTRPFLNFLNTSGPKTVEEDIRNFLEIDGWKKVVSQGDLYTKFVCKNSLYKQREG